MTRPSPACQAILPAKPRPARASCDAARDAAVLAMTLRAEAGGRPVRALEALAALVVNRADTGEPRWPGGIEAVCRAPFGFACWNPRHPRHALLREGAGKDIADACRRIALRAVAGVLADLTGGATHWHADDEQPSWSLGLVPLAEVGGLLFYCPDPAVVPADLRGPRTPFVVHSEVYVDPSHPGQTV